MIRRLLLHGTLLLCLLVSSLVVFPASTQAQAINPDACRGSWGGFLNVPTWYKYLLNTADPVNDQGDCNLARFRLGENNYDYDYLFKIALAIFEIIMRVAALAAIGFVIFGGYQFLLSTGEPDKIAGARTTIVNALVGLMITILAVAIVNLIGATVR